MNADTKKNEMHNLSYRSGHVVTPKKKEKNNNIERGSGVDQILTF
jgi:hypothetical protein